MRSPFNFIVRPVDGRRYDNIKRIGGLDVVVSTSDEDHRFSNRYGEVVHEPLGYDGPVSSGDILIVHHNVFKFYNDMSGRQRSGKSFWKDDLFLVDNDQFFMYHNGKTWTAHDRYCFVQPLPPEESIIFKGESEHPLVGIMRYPNEYLLRKCVNSGDKISFSPDSEYEFYVDGEKLYRMFDHQINFVL
jgi:hypothetical protein